MTSNEASMVTMSGGSLCTISKGCLPQLLACILLDAATRTSQFEFDMFLACVQSIVGALLSERSRIIPTVPYIDISGFPFEFLRYWTAER